MQIAVHRLSRLILISEFGSEVINVDKSSPIFPYLTTRPLKRITDLNDTIHLNCASKVEMAIRHDAGHSLYKAHMHQLYSWITLHVNLGGNAYTAMREFYQAIGLEDDDLPFDRAYKMWQRAVDSKKSPNQLQNPRTYVLQNSTAAPAGFSACLVTASRLIQASPDHFLTADGMPDIGKIKKAVFHSMVHLHRKTQSEVAEYFGTTHQNVSKHLSKVKTIFSPISHS